MKNLGRTGGCILAFAALAAPIHDGRSQPPEHDILGRWSGLASIDDLPQPVEVKVTSLAPNTAGALEVVFDPPRSCRISAQYAGFVNAYHVFRADSGSCAHMGDYADAIKIQSIAGGLKYEFSRRGDAEIGEVGYLLPVK